MDAPLFSPYQADVRRYYEQLQQRARFGEEDDRQFCTLLDQAHQTVARWCLLPDVLPAAAELLRRSERELACLKQHALTGSVPAGTRLEVETVLRRLCNL